jgi:hypothetical protein
MDLVRYGIHYFPELSTLQTYKSYSFLQLLFYYLLCSDSFVSYLFLSNSVDEFNTSIMDATKDTKDAKGTPFRPSTDSNHRSDTDVSHQDIEKQSVPEVHDDSVASIDEKHVGDTNIVNWDGPNDPENPMNWAKSKKVTAVGMASLITFLS